VKSARVLMDAPVLRLLGLLVAAGAAVPLSYLVWRVWELGWADSWEIASSARTRSLLGSTLVLAAAVTAASVAISVPVAWLTVRTDLPWRRTLLVVSSLPLAIPTYVGSYAMIGAFGPRGMLQGFLERFGVQRIDGIYGFWGAFIVLTLFSYPYVLLTVRAAYRRIDPSLEEAARTLGSGGLATFWRVILPQLKPGIMAGSLLVALYTLSDFGAVTMLRYDTFTRAIYTQYQGALNRSSAAVLGLVLVILTIGVLAGEQRLRGRTHTYRLHGGGARVAATTRLGRWRWIAFTAMMTLVAMALIVPMSVIGYWLWRGLRAGEPVWPAWALITNSLSVSGLAAVVTVLAAWPVAMLAVRHPGLLARFVERLSWSGYALPGIVVALALVFFGAQRVPWAYQTTGMLVAAYVVLFLPQAIGALRASLIQVTPSVEEVAKMLGSGPITRFFRVLLPLTRSGVVAGGALVFLTAMKELPATLLLSPTGFSTLATRVWNATAEGFLSRSAGAALALVAMSSVPMGVLVWREERRQIVKSTQPVPRDQLASSRANATEGIPVELTATD
jgi:iron(III) transport system permease protein